MSSRMLVLGLVGIAMTMAPVSGCAAAGSQKAERSAISMGNAKAELQEAYGQITVAVTSLDKIMGAQVADLRPMYDTFVGEVKRLESDASSARNRVVTMQEKNRDYFAAWAQDIDSITNPTIKSHSLARYKETLASYQKVEQMLGQVRDAYQPLTAGLSDLQISMNQDLTPGSIARLRPHYDKARQKAIAVQSAIKNANKAIDSAQQQMTPRATGAGM